MKITLTPQLRQQALVLERVGSVLTCNGTPTDLAAYTATPEAPHDWIVGQPEQVNGAWHVTIVLPHGAEAPEATRFPAPITVTADGPVTLPPHDAPAD